MIFYGSLFAGKLFQGGLFRGSLFGAGGAVIPPEFTLRMETTTASETLTLPMTTNVDVDVDWGDGSAIESFTTNSPSHVYATAGTHDIKITGSCGVFGFNNGGDKLKLLAVLNGGTGFTAGSFLGGFRGCTNLATADFKGLNTSATTNMQLMFLGCSSLTTLDVSGFDTAKVESMANMFRDCPALTTLDVSGFNTANVTDMSQMFQNCPSLTSDPGIHAFNVTALTTAANMYLNANAMLSTAEYNTILTKWEAQAVLNDVPVHFGDAKHSGAGTTARAELTKLVANGGHGWTIDDGGAA